MIPSKSRLPMKTAFSLRQNKRTFVFAGLAGLAIAAIYLLTEHSAHVVPLLPYLFLFACPIMHLFMHGGHGRHAEHGGDHIDNRNSIDMNGEKAGMRQIRGSASQHRHDSADDGA